MKSDIGILCIIFLTSGYLLGFGEWITIFAGTVFAIIGIIKLGRLK